MGKGRAVISETRKKFEDAGFEIFESAEGAKFLGVKKHNCGLLLEHTSSGEVKPVGEAGYWTKQGLAKLEDRGYQKFWWIEGSACPPLPSTWRLFTPLKRLPALAEHLEALHTFEAEVRSLVGMGSLYHEALGTRSTRSVYDRLQGRPDE